MILLTDFTCICPITFEYLNFRHYVFTGLNLKHSSFYMDVNALKLKLRLGTLISECAESLKNKKNAFVINLLW